MRGCLEGTSVIQRHVYGVENAGSGERLAGGLGRGAGVGPLKFRERGGCGMIDLVTCTGNRNLRVMDIWMVLKAKSLDACSKE